MRQHQRQRRWPVAGRVYQVDHLLAHDGLQVSEPVQPGLERAGVEPLPAGQQIGQPWPRNAPLPPAAVIGDQSRSCQTPA